MLYFIYDIIAVIAVAVAIPVFLYRALFRNKVRRGIPERLGFIGREKTAALAGHDVIWVHAVSVGETMAARPLLKGLRAAYPQAKIVLSHVTETGRSVAEKLPEADVCVYFPFDIGWVVRRAVTALHPKLVVVVETEIWPNFFRACRQSGAKVVIANGRISDRSLPRYMRFRSLLQPVLDDVSFFCAQSQQDAERFMAMGAAATRVQAVGNLKYDVPAAAATSDAAAQAREMFRLRQDLPVVVAASTHAGEEEVVLDVVRQLLDSGSQFSFVLVPRHPERASQVAEETKKRGFQPVLRSRLGERLATLNDGEILLVDTIGELMKIYPAADIVFVGGSFVPVGGHNILEPASVGKPVVFGPHMHNFRDIAQCALQRNAGWQVEDGRGLSDILMAVLREPGVGRAAGEKGLNLVSENAGTTERHLQAIRRVMEGR